MLPLRKLLMTNIPKESIALNILRTYNGSNDYLIELRDILLKKQRLPITINMADYVIRNHNKKPVELNKKYTLHTSARKFIKEQYELQFVPEHIFINKLLSRTGDRLHIWGCFDENCKFFFSIYVNKTVIKKHKTVDLPSFEQYNRQPKPHQLTAIKALLENDKFILADDMGLGKSTSAILAALAGKYQRILVVCTATLKLNWKKEIELFESSKDISIVEGSDFTCKKWTIINYDILKNFHFLKEKGQKDEDVPKSVIDFYNFDLVIADEAHYLKNATSNRTKIFNDFAMKIPTRWLLTGTPITNKPIDIYNLLYICESPLTDNWVHFVRRYCDGKQFYRKGTKQKYWVTAGASNLEELNEFIADIYLRRLKKDAIDLPEKIIKEIYLPLEHSRRYNDYLEEYKRWTDELEENDIKPKPSEHLTQLVKVRQLLSEDKVSHTIALAEDFIENGHKVIIFSCFTNTLTEISEHFGKTKSVMIDGSVSSKNRDLAVERFQKDDKIKVFCGNIVAAGAGITLTEGTIVIFNDLDWVPANHSQATDRAYRIGQTKDVYIIYTLIDNTLDIVMFKNLQEKMKNIEIALGDNATFDKDISILNEVIKSIKD
jgi:SWI/SNF-related matrix-associated actin-dependent regulator 1 of chromatin subfamily A